VIGALVDTVAAVADVDDLIASQLIPDADVARPDTWSYKVLLAVADQGEAGATDHELADRLQPPGGSNNTRARRHDIARRALLTDSGRKRPTPSGANATVWTLAEPVRLLLTPRFGQADCDLVASAFDGAATSLSRTDREALDKLRARVALLARRARTAAADSGHPVTVDVKEGPSLGFVAWRLGGLRERLQVAATLHADGMDLQLRLGLTNEASADGTEDGPAGRLREALAGLPIEATIPLQRLIDTGWVAEVQQDGRALQADDAPGWLRELARQPDAEGVLRRMIPAAELQELGSDVVRPVAEILIAAMNVEDAAESSLQDPVQALVRELLWSEDRARALIALANRARQLLFAGPPGTGKTLAARALALALADRARVRLVQFHPTYAYEDFVEGIRPVVADRQAVDSTEQHGGESEPLRYEVRPGVFRKVIEQAQRGPETSRHFLIVDEINRANLPRVLGELLFAFEYRGEENKVELPYSGHELYVPENLWVIGTMNTADRSVALMDAAMRRRFKEVRFDVDFDALEWWHQRHTSAELGREAVARLKRLNDEVIELLDEDRAIGHSFLMRSDLPSVGFETVWREDLEPVLRDHLLGRTDDLPALRGAFLGPL
jgi:MoxR-like ATPase